MKRNILNVCIAALLFIGLAGCSDDNINTGGIPLEVIETVAGEYTRADAAEPMMSGVADRAAAGHKLEVNLGGNKAFYVYADGKWIPEDKALVFDKKGSSLELTLSKSGAGAQDGTKEALLDADVLVYAAENVSPAKQLRDITLEHSRPAIQLEFGDVPVDGSEVKVGDATAYNIPSSGNYQVIVMAGTKEARVSFSSAGINYSMNVTAAGVAGGEFNSNRLYRVQVTLNGMEVTGKIIIADWEELG